MTRRSREKVVEQTGCYCWRLLIAKKKQASWAVPKDGPAPSIYVFNSVGDGERGRR